MTAQPSVLACRIPWAEEPGGLQPKSCKILGGMEGLPSLLHSKAFVRHC